jgi:hypothetical protein
MKRFILTAAALALSGPAFAASQLESALGVQPGVYSTQELVRLHLTRGDNDTPRIYFEIEGNLVLSTHSFVATGDTVPPASQLQPVRRN